MRPRIEIEVGEIVLHGVPVSDVDAFRASLHERLATLAAAYAAPGGWQPAERGTVRGTALGGGAGTGPAELGARVAASVWHGIAATAPPAEGAR